VFPQAAREVPDTSQYKLKAYSANHKCALFGLERRRKGFNDASEE